MKTCRLNVWSGLALTFTLLCAPLLRADTRMTILRDTGQGDEPEEAARVIWSTDPGIRYELQESDDLEHWTTVEGFPSEAQALAQQHVIERETAGTRRFFRVRPLDEQPPAITQRIPAHGAFGVRRFSTITIELDDITGVDPASISLTVGTHGTFTLADDELSYVDGTLVFDLGGDTALGGWGAVIEVSLTVADMLGNGRAYIWGFTLELETVLAVPEENIFVFGSPNAQRSGQEVGPIPTRILAERMAGGPIRMNAGAEAWTLRDVQPDRIIISYSSENPPVFAVGTYLCNLTPVSLDELFYRRVLAVHDDAAEKILSLMTEDISLEDMVDEGSMSLDSSALYFTIGEGGVIQKAFSFGTEVVLPPLGYSLDGWEFTFEHNHNDLLRVRAEELHWWLTPSVRTSFEIDLVGLRRFEAVARGDITAAMVFDVDVLLLGYALEATLFSILEELRPGFWVPIGAIGPIPVSAQVQFNLEFLAEANAGAYLNFRTGLRQSAFAEFGLDYVRSRDPEIGWIYDAEVRSELIPLTVDINGELALRFKLKPSVSLLVYGLAGVEAAVVPGGGVVFSLGAQEGVTGRLEADVSFELAPAGPALAWLDPKPKLSYKIWETQWHIFPPLIDLAFIQHPEAVAVTTGQRLTLHAQAVASSLITYEWYKDGALYQYGGTQLVIAKAHASHAGIYHVRAKAGGQTVHSDTATVTVTVPPGPGPSGMVLIPGGTNAGTDPDFGAYSLTVDSFYMDRYLVTKALWDEVYHWAVTRGGYRFDNAGEGKAANHPVHSVNWYDVVKWCNARSEKEGRSAVYTVNGAVYRTGRSDNVVQTTAAGYRLPTDVEWEYAARGGLQSKRFPWGDEINHSHANYTANGSAYSYDTSPYTTWTSHPTYDDGGWPYTSPVGSFAANGYGLYDMAGNVWDWVFDWPPSWEGSDRVLRGGCWGDPAFVCRVASRDSIPPDFAFDYFGFRSVLPPGQ